MDGIRGPMLSAQFGYAVEILTTYLLGELQNGWKLTFQEPAAGTRPDIRARKGLREVWVDLTSQGDVGHIYTKKLWHTADRCAFPHAEIVYDALDKGTEDLVITNARAEKEGKAPPANTIDMKLLKEQVAAAADKRARQIKYWQEEVGKPFRNADLKKVKQLDQDPHIHDSALASRNGVLAWLNSRFPKSGFEPVKDERPAAGGATRSSRRQGKLTRGPGEDELEFLAKQGRLANEAEEQRELVRLADAEQQRLAGSVLQALGLGPNEYGSRTRSMR